MSVRLAGKTAITFEAYSTDSMRAAYTRAQNIRVNAIAVNAIAPGFTKTAMTESAFGMENLTQAFFNENPLGRAPTTKDIANAALWLASDEAFVTGQIIDVTGGQTLRRIPTPQEMGF